MRTRPIAAAVLIALSAAAARAEDFSRYIWEFPVAGEVQLPAGKQWLLDDLREEVDRILAAGHLAPYYFNAGDLHHEGYFLYVAPGRVLGTLGWAYPHLSAGQQARVKDYVAKELADPQYAPWAGRKLPWSAGTGREGFGKPKGFNGDRWWGMEGQFRPYLHTLYGLWLYGYRSGDWEGIKRDWPRITQFYLDNARTAELYGEFGAHIAMARMARVCGDAGTEKAAVEWLQKCFNAGLNYGEMEQSSLKYYNRLKEKRHNFLRSTHFMLLNMSPETGRFLKDHVKDAVLNKNQAIKSAYPHWWLIAPPYGSWAGNIGPDCEAIGLPREIFGMVFPVERWVAETPADALAGFMISGPDGLGDCYWLEPLVWTIEAHGRMDWTDVREAKR